MRAQLVPVNGGPPIEVVKDMTLVGRRDECDLRLDHKSVSKIHCVLVKTDGLILLRDLGSTNGTRVNGQRVRRAALLTNDQIAFASFKFRLHIGPDLPVPAPGGEYTQQMDPQEIADLNAQSGGGKEEGGSGVGPLLPEEAVQINPLPDVYSEEPRSK
jgi:FHA domain